MAPARISILTRENLAGRENVSYQEPSAQNGTLIWGRNNGGKMDSRGDKTPWRAT